MLYHRCSIYRKICNYKAFDAGNFRYNAVSKYFKSTKAPKIHGGFRQACKYYTAMTLPVFQILPKGQSESCKRPVFEQVPEN
jgi:hypothetical protein